jgi:hypothetical protein
MDKEPTIATLYPDLNEEQVRMVGDNMEQYLILVLRIYERICTDPATYAQFKVLTAAEGTLDCTPPRSHPSLSANANKST